MNLLNGTKAAAIHVEPFRQLWYAVAELAFGNTQIEAIQVQLNSTKIHSARVLPILVPLGSRLVPGIKGSP